MDQTATPGALDQQLGNLDRVERRALAQVVTRDHEHQAAAAVDGLVLANAAHQ